MAHREHSNIILIAAAVATGIAGAGFLVVSERALGLVAFEPIAHLWALWSVSSAVILFSTQQWLAVSDRRINWSVLSPVLGLCGAAALFGYLFGQQLFGGRTWFWPLAMAAIPLGTFMMGIARGTWARHQRFGGLAFILVAENGIRLLAGLLLVGRSDLAQPFALALLLGFVAAAVRPRSAPVDAVVEASAPSSEHGLLAATAFVGLLSHSAINGGPTLLALMGSPDAEVSRFFVVLTVARLPMLAALGLVPRAVTVFNEMVAASRFQELRTARLRLFLAGSAAGMCAFVGSYLLGPWFLNLLFGVEVQPMEVALASTALTLASSSLIANSALVAERRVRFQICAWALPMVLAVAGLTLAGRPTVGAVLVALLAAEVMVFSAVTLAAAPRIGRQIEPNENRELDPSGKGLSAGATVG